eukprot:218300-Alexandrium_andersonii.AAC.1
MYVEGIANPIDKKEDIGQSMQATHHWPNKGELTDTVKDKIEKIEKIEKAMQDAANRLDSN